MLELAMDVLGTFVRAFRLLFLRPVTRYATEPSRTAVVVLITISIASGTLLEAAIAGENRYVSGWGVLAAAGGWAAYTLLLWLAKPHYAPFGLPRILADSAAIGTLTAAMVAAVYVAGKSTGNAEGWPLFGVFGALALWWAIALWRTGRTAWTGSQWRYGFRAAQYAVIVALLMPDAPVVRGDATQPGFDVWKTAHAYYSFYTGLYGSGEEDDGSSPVKWVDVERTYYMQPQLVSAALEKVLPSDPDRSEIYLLAAAGFADQDVFKSEVEKTRELFDKRFGTAGRSIVAINHADTVEDTPLANVSNIENLLAGLAHKMDTENDVLVMFLTSHGTRGRFAVNFSGFSFNSLTPGVLRAMLDTSGIKNRVLIISACFSGSFVKELASDNTLIMTAASDSRTSFGCSNEREWTFFGDALFNHALRETYSFESAFAKARETVGQWEREQGITPSDPQMSAGSAIHAKLKDVAEAFAQQQASSQESTKEEDTPTLRQAADSR